MWGSIQQSPLVSAHHLVEVPEQPLAAASRRRTGIRMLKGLMPPAPAPASGGNGHRARKGEYTGVGESAAQTAGEELMRKGMLAARDFWFTC